ncbi:MAG: TrkA family potassium uptake protein [Oscillospiraceae bacterium]|jgi:trk system potassium uptake protein TrkA|nr:TrkA family potassium uptake protein [Oscillospiraceae bacterium]
MKNENVTVIAGCGRLGAHMAEVLLAEGGGVLVIDRQNDAFGKLGAGFDGILLNGDATDLGVLNEADLKRASALIAATGDDNTNILIAQLAKSLYNVPRVIARLYNPARRSINEALGIGNISPVLLVTREIADALNIMRNEEAE